MNSTEMNEHIDKLTKIIDDVDGLKSKLQGEWIVRRNGGTAAHPLFRDALANLLDLHEQMTNIRNAMERYERDTSNTIGIRVTEI